MSHLSQLDLVDVERPVVTADPKQAARDKISESIAEQMACAKALIAKKPAPKKTVVRYRDVEGEDGETTRERYEKEIDIRQWFTGDGTSWIIEPRYGNRPLFGKGKGYTVKTLKDVPKVLETLGKAVAEGELDDVLKKLKDAAFKKAS